MDMLKAKYMMALSLFACLPLSSYAETEPVISITSRLQGDMPEIIIRSKYDFERDISLKVKTDPRFLPSDVLIKTVSEMGMVDANGVSITSGFDIDPNKDIVLAFSGGTSEIIKSSPQINGVRITASFKDNKGNFVTPSTNNVAVYNTSGEKLCFSYQEPATASPKMAFVLLLDRSGSMENVINDVRIKAKSFLKALPASSECSVASFSGKFNYHNSGFEDCNNGDFKLDSLRAYGMTDLYSPLLDAYQKLDKEYPQDYQKAVILITDGQISEDRKKRQELIKAKKDILTFVYFLGKKNDQYLTGLADGFLSNTANIRSSLGKYFGSLSAGYNAQRTIQVEECKGGSYGLSN